MLLAAAPSAKIGVGNGNGSNLYFAPSAVVKLWS